jgi:NitT/TauT family transport system substrate-binding protein
LFGTRLRRLGWLGIGLWLAAGLSAASAHADDVLRVGKATQVAFSFVPLDVGIQTGIFKKHGLDVDESYFAGSAKLHQAITADALDIGVGSGTDFLFLAKGAPELGVAAMAGAPLFFVLIVAKDGPIRTIADLKGKTLSVTNVSTVEVWVLRELSRQQGWGPNGFNMIEAGASSSQFAALKTGQTQGMLDQIADAWRLEDAGEVRILARLGGLVKDFHVHAIFASTAIIQKNPDAVRRFLAGWFETIAYMRQHKDETVKIAAPIVGASPDIIARTYDEVMPMYSADGKFSRKALDGMSQSFVDLGLLPTPPDMSQLYTERFLPGS